jgi:hypothetical protein
MTHPPRFFPPRALTSPARGASMGAGERRKLRRRTEKRLVFSSLMTLRSFPQSSSAYSGAALWLAAILAWMGAAFAPSGARAQGVPVPPPAAAPASAEESQPVRASGFTRSILKTSP